MMLDKYSSGMNTKSHLPLQTTNRASFIITIDVEDWFQVENFKAAISRNSWSGRDLRVEHNVHRLLDCFDSMTLANVPSIKLENQHINNLQTSDGDHIQQIRATFFILGWLAKRLPHLVREIYSRGHEVASHGFNHDLCPNLTMQQLSEDLTRSRLLLQDIIGDEVYGYRAPSFSINDQVLDQIRKCGYRYDSSYNSFGMNSRYGQITASKNEIPGRAFFVTEGFMELPVSNLAIYGRTIPFGGGGYFRLYPLPLLKAGINALLKTQGHYMLYLHPWEIDPNQPRVYTESALNRFRHYLNLGNTMKKLQRLIHYFRHCNFKTCNDFLLLVAKN